MIFLFAQVEDAKKVDVFFWCLRYSASLVEVQFCLWCWRNFFFFNGHQGKSQEGLSVFFVFVTIKKTAGTSIFVTEREDKKKQTKNPSVDLDSKLEI